MPQVNISNYPSLMTIANLIRSFVNDDKAGATGTPGEGQILTNTSVTLQNFMNSAIRDTYRDMRIMGQKVLIKDNYLLIGVPPINSPLGIGTPNPAIQTSLQFTGYFDGLTQNSNYTLPTDLLLPLEVWQRLNQGSSLEFNKVNEATGALPSRTQTQSVGEWEWRTDGLWMNGSTSTTDLRLRYICTYPDLVNNSIDWNNTFVPIMDCEEAIADKISVMYAKRLGGEALLEARTSAKESLFKLYSQFTRSRQKIDFQRDLTGNNRNNFASFLF